MWEDVKHAAGEARPKPGARSPTTTPSVACIVPNTTGSAPFADLDPGPNPART